MKKTVTEIIEYANGTKEWRRDGTWYRAAKRHRDDGPAIECANGNKEWWRDGKLHRDDGPAIEWANGTKMWYRDGKRHRDDGPAIELADGNKEWYLEGGRVTEAAFNTRRQTSAKPEFNEVAALKAKVEQMDRRVDALEHPSPRNVPANKSPGGGP